MRFALVLALFALGCGGNRRSAHNAPVTADWVARDFGEGRVRYRVPGDWNCQATGDSDAICVGKSENDAAKIGAGIPQGPPDEVFAKLQAKTEPPADVARTRINGHEAIIARSGEGAIVVLLFSDNNKYFFMLAWLLRAPFAAECRQVLETVEFRA